MKTYKLKLNSNQLDAINKALEIYQRISMGQFGELTGMNSQMYDLNWQNDLSDEQKESLEAFGHHLVGLPKNAYRGIAQCAYSPKVCHDIYQVIRHRLAWDRQPEGGIGVHFDTPFKISVEPLPEIEEDNG